MAYVLGITGGIGTGKSEVLKLLEKYGFKPVHTDEVAKELMLPGGEIYNKLIEAFGEGIISKDTGRIDKEAYASVIYGSGDSMAKSNAIIHPPVWRRVEEIIRESGDGKIAVETALPDETFRRLCDTIWYIHAPLKVRIARLMQSRGFSNEKCFDIIGKQRGEREYSLFADFMVDNGGRAETTEKQIRELL